MPLPLQLQSRPQEGLAIVWDAEPGVARYAFIVGIADAPAPEIDAIMQGRTREFAMLGIPTRFTGAVDIGTPAGEERQYGLFAYKTDGSLTPVANVRFLPARSAPRDREYHPLLPPPLERDKNRPKQSSAAKPAAKPAPATTATPPPPTPVPTQAPQRPADPWDLLDGGKKAPPPQEAPQRTGRPQEHVAPPATAPDPWAALDQASAQPSTQRTQTPPPTPTPDPRKTAPREAVPDPWDIVAGATAGQEPAAPLPDRPRPAQRPARPQRVQPPRRPAPLVDPWDELELELRLNPDPDPNVPVYYADPLAYLYARERAEAATLGLPLPTYLEPEAPPPAVPAGEQAPATTGVSGEATGAGVPEAVPAEAISAADARADQESAVRDDYEAVPAEPWVLDAPSETPIEPVLPQPEVAHEAEAPAVEQAAAVAPGSRAIDPLEEELRAMWAAEEQAIAEPLAPQAVPLIPEPVTEAIAPAAPQPTIFDLLAVRYDLPSEYLQQALPLAALDRVARRLVLVRSGSLKDHGAVLAGRHAQRRAHAREAAAAVIPIPAMDGRPVLSDEPLAVGDAETGVPSAAALEAAIAAAAVDTPSHVKPATAIADEEVAGEERAAAPEQGESPEAEPAVAEMGAAAPDQNAAPIDTAVKATPDEMPESAPVEQATEAVMLTAADTNQQAATELPAERAPEVEEPEREPAQGPWDEQHDAVETAPAPPAIQDEPRPADAQADEAAGETTAPHLPQPESGLQAPRAGEPAPEPAVDERVNGADSPVDAPAESAEVPGQVVADVQAVPHVAPEPALDGLPDQVAAAPDAHAILPVEEPAGISHGADAVSPPAPAEDQPAPRDESEQELPATETLSGDEVADRSHAPDPAEHGEFAGGLGATDEPAASEAHEIGPEADVLDIATQPAEPATTATSQDAAAGTHLEYPEAPDLPPEAEPAQSPMPDDAAHTADVPPPETEAAAAERADEPAPDSAIDPGQEGEARAADNTGVPRDDAAASEEASVLGSEAVATAFPRISTVPHEESEHGAVAPDERPEAHVFPEGAPAWAGAELGEEIEGDVRLAEPAANVPTPGEQNGAPARPGAQPPAGFQPATEVVGDVSEAESPARAATPPPTENEEPAAPSSPEIAAMLDEAELYLLPQWADYAEVARILDRVAAQAPREPHLLALRGRLEAAQRGGPNIDGLLGEAQQRLDAGDHWGAVDLYEQALSQQPGDERAGRGLERARLLARWTARLAGAGNDAPRLQQLGAEYAENAPELAAQAFAEAFSVEATILSLRGWLLALAATENWTEIGAVARRGLAELREYDRVSDSPAPQAALGAIEGAASARSRQDTEAAIAAFAQALVTNAQRPPEPDRNEQHDSNHR